MTKQDLELAQEQTLVERLRDNHGPMRERMIEAADRIESLESQVSRLRKFLLEAYSADNWPKTVSVIAEAINSPT